MKGMPGDMLISVADEVSAVDRILVKHPREAFRSEATLRAQWKRHGYTSRPDFTRAKKEYDRLTRIFRREGIELHFLARDTSTTIDSIYVRDAALLTPRGAVLCNMGKRLRRMEPAALGRFFNQKGIPILGKIQDPGRLEGGDVVWFNHRCLAVGRGYRTNDEGIRQLQVLLEPAHCDIYRVSLPHWHGPEDVFHLMSIISPVRKDLAVVYSKPLAVNFRQWLTDRGIRFIEVGDREYETMGSNVLALSPSKCLMLKGNPETRRKLEREQIKVICYEGEEISLKGGGGPTCLTRPLARG